MHYLSFAFENTFYKEGDKLNIELYIYDMSPVFMKYPDNTISVV